jgi:hypothetical protein
MKSPIAWLWACAACLLTVPSAVQAREGVAVITILSVPVTVLRDAAKFEAPEGASLQAEDIVETLPFTSLTRLELDDGTIVDLGPSSRVLLKPHWASAAGSDGAMVYLLEGWAKVTVGKPTPATKALVSTPSVDLMASAQDAVIHTHGGEAEVFAESGNLTVSVRGPDGKSSQIRVDAGAFLVRRADGSVSNTPRPAPAFIQAVPRPFMDTLPTRLAKFKGKEVRLGTPGRLQYADAQDWLNAEPRIRTRFVPRWRELAQDEAFRRALMAQLTLHPEWRPILMPPTVRKPAQPAYGALKSHE